jgi:hypothetical protein
MGELTGAMNRAPTKTVGIQFIESKNAIASPQGFDSLNLKIEATPIGRGAKTTGRDGGINGRDESRPNENRRDLIH